MPGKKNNAIDEQIEESFPASDPPSFMGGNHVIGAPERKPGKAKAKRKVLSKTKSRAKKQKR